MGLQICTRLCYYHHRGVYWSCSIYAGDESVLLSGISFFMVAFEFPPQRPPILPPVRPCHCATSGCAREPGWPADVSSQVGTCMSPRVLVLRVLATVGGVEWGMLQWWQGVGWWVVMAP